MVERPEELKDPSSLGSAYGRLARLVSSGFKWESISRLEIEPHYQNLALTKKTERLKARMQFILVIMGAVTLVLTTGILGVYISFREKAVQAQVQHEQALAQVRLQENMAQKNELLLKEVQIQNSQILKSFQVRESLRSKKR